MLKCLNPSCGREFLYAAKKVRNDKDVEHLKKEGIEPIFIEYPTTIETHICPFCASLEIAEVEKTEPQIESIIKVPYEEADAKLKEGYEVKEVYANTVTLVKKAKETKL
jgi:hypothetical protein